MIKEGDFVTWFCDVDKVQKSGVVQSIEDVVFEMEVDLKTFEPPEPEADLSSFKGDSLYKTATVLENDGKLYAVVLDKLSLTQPSKSTTQSIKGLEDGGNK